MQRYNKGHLILIRWPFVFGDELKILSYFPCLVCSTQTNHSQSKSGATSVWLGLIVTGPVPLPKPTTILLIALPLLVKNRLLGKVNLRLVRLKTERMGVATAVVRSINGLAPEMRSNRPFWELMPALAGGIKMVIIKI